MKKIILLPLLSFLYLFTNAQMVSLSPPDAGAGDNAILIFDASEGNGELIGASKVYLHHGAIIDGPTSTNWQYVIGNWGADDGIGEMTPVAGETDKWQIDFTPTILEYYGVPSNEDIFRLSLVFRNADGTIKATLAPGNYGWGTVEPNLDIYINLNSGDYVSINAPTNDSEFLSSGQPVSISGTASNEVSSMKIWVNEGTGFEEKASVSSGTSINHSYFPSASGLVQIKITAIINGDELETEKDYAITILQPVVVENLPINVKSGINYDTSDASKVTLVLEAPNKDFVFVLGDFNNWIALDNYQMKKTPNSQYFWLELTGLTPNQPYVFQYWMEEGVKVGDPYAEQTADPWNDQWIDEVTFPNLPFYDKTDFGFASVLQTGQIDYPWGPSEDSWERPDVNHLVIYELLVRDFIGTHSWEDLEDSLAYIANLGVDAIEIMPWNEFEGNESWGYNPAYYFAPDKYYGTKEDLKHFIEIAHQHGLAVIMDVVMNHAFGQNPMVKMYFDENTGTPSAINPWFNKDYVGQYQWGYDWNHESPYVIDFLDRLNKFWIEEYHVDGYRFDFTKGFTNYAPGGSVDGFDQSRINIMKRMADEIWDFDPECYIILEHWAPSNEETILGDYGMKMWRNKSYDFVPATVGNITGNFGGMNSQDHVTFFDSHDERRIAEHCLTEGQSNGAYDIGNPLVMYERVKMAAAFGFLNPGPKMLWQFDELGYDIHIDFNGRVGNKPLPWGSGGLGYYEDPLRQYIYDAYQGILDVRNTIGADTLSFAQTNHKTSGSTRRLVYNNVGQIDLVVIGNFGLGDESINPNFPSSGIWYDYFSGDSIDVNLTSEMINLKAGEWHIFTDKKLNDGLPGVVAVYENPVTISPDPFTKNDQITITFDAKKASPNGTAGLIDAEKVYIHSGVILSDPSSTTLENIVGTFTDDGIGLMTEVSPDIWEITLTIADYYSLGANDQPFKIGMYFRDADNMNVGMGFRNGVIFYDVDSDQPFITVEPAAYTIDDEITITFNAKKGNSELINADKIYMHSSVGLIETTTPQNNAWGNVIGNWGQDNGVGEMTEITNSPDLWEITLTPKDYFGLSNGDLVYWLAAVFRSADGNTKGTGQPGSILNGFIHTNQDFFIQNQITVSNENFDLKNQEVVIFPNPAKSQVDILMKNISGKVRVELFDLMGKRVLLDSLKIDGLEEYIHSVDIGNVPNGMYFVKIVGSKLMITKELIKNN